MELKLTSFALGCQRKDNGCTVSFEEKLEGVGGGRGAGRKTSVWFLFQELFTKVLKSGRSLFLLVLSQQLRVGPGLTVTLGLNFKFTIHPSLRVDLLPLPYQ